MQGTLVSSVEGSWVGFCDFDKARRARAHLQACAGRRGPPSPARGYRCVADAAAAAAGTTPSGAYWPLWRPPDSSSRGPSPRTALAHHLFHLSSLPPARSLSRPPLCRASRRPPPRESGAPISQGAIEQQGRARFASIRPPALAALGERVGRRALGTAAAAAAGGGYGRRCGTGTCGHRSG